MLITLQISGTERHLINVGKLPSKDTHLTNSVDTDTEYKKDGCYIHPTIGFYGLRTSYFKDMATLLNGTKKQYHSKIIEQLKTKIFFRINNIKI